MTRASDRRKRLQWALKMMQAGNFELLTPATIREVLDAEAKKPMRAGNKDLEHASLFGDSHLQRDLF